MNIPALRLCAARVWCQPEVSMITEWDVKILSNPVSAQCKLQNKYYPLNLTTLILRAALWLDPVRTWFFSSDSILTRPYKILVQATTST